MVFMLFLSPPCCKSGEQISKRGGEDLRIEIIPDKDGNKIIKLREVPPIDKPQYKDIPSTWNGTKLKGLKKTVVFLLRLKQGEHSLRFIPYQGAIIEKEPAIKLIKDTSQVKFDLEEQAEDGDRRPWYTFALINTLLKTVTADVTCKWRIGDDDDVKLIIDGEIQNNTSFTILHKNWAWSANILKKLQGQKRETKTFQIDQPRGLHYIEFWVDKTPILHEVLLDLGEIGSPKPKPIGWVTDPAEGIKEVNFREKASHKDKVSKIIGAIPVDEEIDILEEFVIGDYVEDRSDIWHKIRYQNKEGYILSTYVDIKGKTKVDVQRLIVGKSKEVGIDPEIILALAECESLFKPYAVSEDQAKGVMQLSKKLLIDLNDSAKKFYSQVEDPFDIEQNIQAGIKYFKYLYDKYRNDKDRFRKSVVAYNSGPGDVPLDEPLNLKLYELQTQKLVNCVQAHLKKKTFKKVLKTLKSILVIGFILSANFFAYEEFIGPGIGFLVQARIPLSEMPFGQIFQIDSPNPGERLYKLVDDLDNDGNVEEIKFRYYYDEEWMRVTEINYKGQSIKVNGGSPSGFTQDLDSDGNKEVVVKLGVGANGIVTRVYKFENGRLKFLPLVPDFLPEGFFGYVEFIDYDDDDDLEVRVNQRAYPPDPCKKTADIYEYIDGKFILTEQIQTYEPTCREMMEEFQG